MKENSTKHKYACSLGEMIGRVQNEPKLELIYSGIKEKSVGIVFGPSKSGKTMFCENLGMAISAGVGNYLELPINITNRDVLFISFEEYYANRTERNEKQSSKLIDQYGRDWLENYVVVNENLPRYVSTGEHWNELAELINSIEPGVVFLDSLTHMYEGSIEDSKVAMQLTKNLRSLSEATDTTIVAIHHTHKMYGQCLSIDTIAGSRVIAQELDFMIGLNRTPDGQKYIKDVAFRYVACNDETVRTYNIDDNCWLNVTGEASEGKILAALDGRKDDTNKSQIYQFIAEQIENGNNSIPAEDIVTRFRENPQMARTTVFNNLKKLYDENKIIKMDKGHYSIAA